ncbi:MAG: N-formylglutamate amidohydrolase [Alphaproteobacteria bacterium]
MAQREPRNYPGTTGGFDEKSKGFQVLRPRVQTIPVVLASPHSGRHYSSEFIDQTRLDPTTLRRSEDSFVDEMFASGPANGAPLLRASFPRAYVDVNREPYELDPAMFSDPLPGFVNTDSRRVLSGLGTVARIVANGTPIYRCKLTFAEAEARIDRYYRPYHVALGELIDDTVARFGGAILLDCHSMPSSGEPLDTSKASGPVDFVLGDRHGQSCHPAITATVARVLTDLGFNLRHNAPYSGGYTTGHYGAPHAGIHALQIEINRALYMDEARFERRLGLGVVAAHMATVIRALGTIDPAALTVPLAAE